MHADIHIKCIQNRSGRHINFLASRISDFLHYHISKNPLTKSIHPRYIQRVVYVRVYVHD